MDNASGSKPSVPPPVWAVLCAIAMKLCQLALPALGFSCPGPYHRHLCAVFAFVGVALALGGIASFRQAGTTTNPMSPENASQLVMWGVYRYTRNPMYLGLLFILSGWCLLLQNFAAFIFLPVFLKVMTRFQIAYEEQALTDTFGDEYLAYKERTPRWLIRS